MHGREQVAARARDGVSIGPAGRAAARTLTPAASAAASSTVSAVFDRMPEKLKHSSAKRAAVATASTALCHFSRVFAASASSGAARPAAITFRNACEHSLAFAAMAWTMSSRDAPLRDVLELAAHRRLARGEPGLDPGAHLVDPLVVDVAEEEADGLVARRRRRAAAASG